MGRVEGPRQLLLMAGAALAAWLSLLLLSDCWSFFVACCSLFLAWCCWSWLAAPVLKSAVLAPGLLFFRSWLAVLVLKLAVPAPGLLFLFFPCVFLFPVCCSCSCLVFFPVPGLLFIFLPCFFPVLGLLFFVLACSFCSWFAVTVSSFLSLYLGCRSYSWLAVPVPGLLVLRQALRRPHRATAIGGSLEIAKAICAIKVNADNDVNISLIMSMTTEQCRWL